MPLKGDQTAPVDQRPPIALSNLESNILDPHGLDQNNHPLFEFDQNCVPFDFDGDVLLWMIYQPKGARELKIYDFKDEKAHSIMRFQANDGIISHCKLVYGSFAKESLEIIYVQRCN